MRKTRNSSKLIRAAREARENARAEYSRFRVGAAIEAEDGRIFTGANVESSSYGLSMCAERVALFKALSEGAGGFKRLAIVTQADPPSAPCGACRQLLWDYARGIEIIMAGPSGETVETTIEELFPKAFGEEDL